MIDQPILPGATVGVLGSGQLGRMFALAARRMGYRVHTLSPDTDTPTGQVADREVVADYEDLDAVRDFARDVQVVTFEFENVPAVTVEAVSAFCPVRPGGQVLFIAQNRLREKTFLAENGLPCAAFRAVSTRSELAEAVAQLGCPAILKTAGFGYDGKGQARINVPSEADAAWDAIGGQPAVLESRIAFEREVSVVAARRLDGQFIPYRVIENAHQDGILDISISPSELGGKEKEIEETAQEIARTIMETLNVVGVLCVEFFVLPNGEVLVNEIAPRPHNSGHLTMDACVTSQFEQQLRAVCGLPLGAPDLIRPAAMANLMGDLWTQGEPNWAAALRFPEVKLHLYGKMEARPGRKMGHLTVTAPTAAEAEQKVRDARMALLSSA